MKKYKLIKEYPGSPELGIIYTEILGRCGIKGILFKHPTKDNQCLPLHGFINYPEFWEEIIEKNYEILSIKRKNSYCPTIIKQVKHWDDTGAFLFNNVKNEFNTCKATLIYILAYYDIHSIKRLADGEIFTVGDRVMYQGNCFDDISSILKFELRNNSLYACSGSLNFHIKWIKHIKQPLFTTEDGVDIYKNDSFYFVKIKESKSIDFLWEVSESHDIRKQKFIYEPDNEIYFSTKEKAEEYILMNKPCLSISDIKSIGITNKHKLEKLVNLIESRL